MSKIDITARPITAGKANTVAMAVVAHTIAEGDPPEWLVLALANFADDLSRSKATAQCEGSVCD